MDVPGDREKTWMYPTGKRAGDPGFTVLELVVVMALLATAAIAVTVWIPDISDRAAVDRAATVLERELWRVADDARRTRDDRSVSLQGHAQSLILVAGSRIVALDPSLTATWIAASEAGSNASQGTITFWGLGGASGGTFEVSRGRAHAKINVDWLTARIQR